MTALTPTAKPSQPFYPSADGEPLQLRLAVEGELIGFYREDTGEKLLIPDELVKALEAEVKARHQAEERAEQAEALLARYREHFGELPE